MPAKLTTSTVARRLNCSESGVRKLANEGRLRVERTANGIRLYDEAEVERYRAERGR